MLKMMANASTFVLALCFLLAPARATKAGANYLTPGFRPPSVPLVVVDPYLSVWSNADHLYDDFPRHWVGTVVCLSGMIQIDGKPYRFMAKDTDLAQDNMQQANVSVYPTQTVYAFLQDGVQLQVKFTTSAFRLTALTFTVESVDGKSHDVKLYYDNTAEGAVADVSENVVWDRDTKVPGYAVMRIGTEAQDYLGQGSDRINWGYWYVAVPNDDTVTTSMANSSIARASFIKNALLPSDDTHQPRPCSDNWPVLAVVWELGSVTPNSTVSKHLYILYDQVFSIRFFGTAMAPEWRYGNTVAQLIAGTEYSTLIEIADNTDVTVLQSLYTVGGSNYTTICSLAYRQAMGGITVVWNNVTDQAWMFLKEISSDGDVSTVDVLFPASPFYFWVGEDILIELLLKPLMEYSNNQSALYGLNVPYNLQWAPHHLGHWPICDLPPSKQEQMPMEETGNMLIMLALLVDNSQSTSYLKPYWKLLKIWGDYLVATLPDPGNQLCTDDFEGPSPHNVNLAAKGIVGLGSYAYMLRMDGQTALADHYDQLNKGFVQYWMKNASDPDHYKRQYDLADSWSLKYNLFYQKVLKFDLFPDSVFETEESYYQTKMNKYGVPLDDRADFTKTDWLMWVAAMGTDDQFRIITDAVYKFANETPDRVPFTDWYHTTTGKLTGFRARPVIGGLYARMLLYGKK